MLGSVRIINICSFLQLLAARQFVLRFPARFYIAVRYMKCLADRFQLKLREGKTKRKKPLHF